MGMKIYIQIAIGCILVLNKALISSIIMEGSWSRLYTGDRGSISFLVKHNLEDLLSHNFQTTTL